MHEHQPVCPPTPVHRNTRKPILVTFKGELDVNTQRVYIGKPGVTNDLNNTTVLLPELNIRIVISKGDRIFLSHTYPADVYYNNEKILANVNVETGNVNPFYRDQHGNQIRQSFSVVNPKNKYENVILSDLATAPSIAPLKRDSDTAKETDVAPEIEVVKRARKQGFKAPTARSSLSMLFQSANLNLQEVTTNSTNVQLPEQDMATVGNRI